jgi:hypothetical protein
VQAPAQGEHAHAVEDEGDPGEQGKRGEADVRIGDDHDAGEQLHRSGEEGPAAMFLNLEGGDDADHADRNQPDTATFTATVPNPGDLTASGNGVKAAAAVTSKAVGAGPAQLLIKAKGKKKRKLNETGKVKLNVAITYTPTGGDPSTQSTKVKLKKR